jgi:hypothetical protein
MRKNSIVAVNGDTQQAGLIVYWSANGTVMRADLVAAWQSSGFDPDDVCEAPSPKQAAARAVREQRRDRADSKVRRLHRPLDKRRGYAVVDEHAEGMDLDHSTLAKVTVDDIGQVQVETDDDELRVRIESAYRRIVLKELSSEDLRKWVINDLLREKFDAVGLRRDGGFYFIGNQHVETWTRMADAIESTGCMLFFGVDAMHTDRVLKSVLAGLIDEADKKATKGWNQIAKGEAGEGALTTTAAECDAMKARVSRVCDFLGVALPELLDKLDRLKANFSAAALRASNDQDYTDLADMAGL